MIIGSARVSHWVGVWLVQERISAVRFLGQGGVLCDGDLSQGSEGSGPLESPEHCSLHLCPCPGSMALRQKNISVEGDQGYNRCCLPPLVQAQISLSSARVLAARALSRCWSLRSSWGGPFPEMIKAYRWREAYRSPVSSLQLPDALDLWGLFPSAESSCLVPP